MIEHAARQKLDVGLLQFSGSRPSATTPEKLEDRSGCDKGEGNVAGGWHDNADHSNKCVVDEPSTVVGVDAPKRDQTVNQVLDSGNRSQDSWSPGRRRSSQSTPWTLVPHRRLGPSILQTFGRRTRLQPSGSPPTDRC